MINGREAHHSPGNENWRNSGDRIDALLDSMSAGGPIMRERAEHLLREVVGLYGAALARIVVCAEQEGHDTLLRRLADDDLVASLLLVHGLHPDGVEVRVRRALDSVRPYLGSHGGDVELLGIDGGVARLRFQGTCKSCPSSSVTLELAVEGAIKAAAPEVTDLEVETAPRESGVIAPDSLFAKVHRHAHWAPLPELAELCDGEVRGYTIRDHTILVCRNGDEVFAFADRCGHCLHPMAGAVLHRRAGGKTGESVLRCPRCHAHFDVRRAGAAIDGSEEHLTPLPVLSQEGVLSVSLPAGAEQ